MFLGARDWILTCQKYHRTMLILDFFLHIVHEIPTQVNLYEIGRILPKI